MVDGKYVWAVFEGFDIFVADLEGNIQKQLTNEPGYDAEATLSPDGSKIVFTSMRDGDLDIYLAYARAGGDYIPVAVVSYDDAYSGETIYVPLVDVPDDAQVSVFERWLFVMPRTPFVAAGVEHLGRGTVGAVDRLLIVADPGRRAVETAQRIRTMAADTNGDGVVNTDDFLAVLSAWGACP